MHICRHICIIYRAPTPLTLPLLPSPTLPSPPALPAVVSSRCLVPFTQLAFLEELPIFGIARRPLEREVSWTHHSLPEHKTSTTSTNAHFNVQAAALQKGIITHASKAKHAKVCLVRVHTAVLMTSDIGVQCRITCRKNSMTHNTAAECTIGKISAFQALPSLDPMRQPVSVPVATLAHAIFSHHGRQCLQQLVNYTIHSLKGVAILFTAKYFSMPFQHSIPHTVPPPLSLSCPPSPTAPSISL